VARQQEARIIQADPDLPLLIGTRKEMRRQR
jgi:hypothetical protein